MAIPHADSQEFSCSDSSGNPKTVLRRVDELQVTCDGCAPHSTGCSSIRLPTPPTYPPCAVTWSPLQQAGYVTLISTRRRPGRLRRGRLGKSFRRRGRVGHACCRCRCHAGIEGVSPGGGVMAGGVMAGASSLYKLETRAVQVLVC